MKQKILILDGHNLLHRSRSGFQRGEYSVVYNFFRQFRSLVEQHRPDTIWFVLEGTPKAREALLPEYKANRIVKEGTKEHQALQDFFRQVGIIVPLLKSAFPVSVIRHPDYECDDIISELVRRNCEDDCTVVSNDSDFTQLLDDYEHVKIWNPMKKCWVEQFECNYVTWKSLRGDQCDNVPGIPGIGDKRALTIASDPHLLRDFLSDELIAEQFAKNVDLIKFETLSDVQWEQCEISVGECCMDTVKHEFNMMGFKSITEKGWEKFSSTFERIV